MMPLKRSSAPVVYERRRIPGKRTDVCCTRGQDSLAGWPTFRLTNTLAEFIWQRSLVLHVVPDINL